RRAKLSRVKDSATVVGGSSQAYCQQVSAPPGRHPASDSRPSTLSLPRQPYLSIPASDSFSQRLLAGAVEAAQHLEETLAHATDTPASSSYLDTPLNYELYLSSSSQSQPMFPAPMSNGVNNAANSLRSQDYLHGFDAQRSLPLPPISTIRNIPPQPQHHRIGFVFDASIGQYRIKDVNHIPRSQGDNSLHFNKFSSSRHNTVLAAGVPIDDEVIVIDDEPDQTCCGDATPLKADIQKPSRQLLPSQSTSTFTYTKSSHKQTAAPVGTLSNSSTASGNVKSIYSRKEYLYPRITADVTSGNRNTCDKSKNYLHIDSNPSIVDGCLLDSQGKWDQQVKPFDKSQNQITESGFNFSPAYLSSRRGGFDFGASNLGRNAGVSLDATLKPSACHGHPFGDAMAKPHYSSDDTLMAPSVFVFPDNEQVEISDEPEATELSLRGLDKRSGRAKVSGSKKNSAGHTPDLMPFSPPGKPPNSMDEVQSFQLLVNENGSVCPKTQEEVNLTGRGRVSMQDFELLKVLGTGAYGKVFLVRKRGGRDAGKLYALKQLKKASIVQKTKTTEHTRTERQVLEAIRDSPFLVTLHYAFQTDSKLNLILDFVNGGEMFTHLYQREHFKEEEVRIYIGEITLALETLHKLGVIYRDIKLENILLDSEGHIILTDFGLSKEFLPTDPTHRTYSFCGTIEYMAPEVVKGGHTGHDFAVDWWSLGVLTYELLTGASPFTVDGEKNSQSEISKRIMKCNPHFPKTFSPEAKDLIQRLLTKDPSRRLGSKSIDEVKRHPFFKTLSWEDLAQKKVPAPFKPKIRNELDLSNFSEEFTKMAATESPAIVPNTAGEKLFKGYSYVAPSIIFTENSVSFDLMQRNREHQPDDATIWTASHFKNSTFFQKYELDMKGPALGDGTFSICRKCRNIQTGQLYAVKIVSRRSSCHREVQMLTRCQGHPNVVTLVEVLHDDYHAYIVMELLRGGELLERLRKKKFFTETEASELMWKLVKAVSFMHSKGVVHRDLKPENLLFEDRTDRAELKIVDFGFASEITKNETMMTPCFTLPYSAPEVLRQMSSQKGGYDESCDLWSLGVILYSMLSGRAPFQDSGQADSAATVMQRIKDGEFDLSGPEWRQVSSTAKELIKGLLTVEPTERLRMHELLRHRWLKRNIHSPPLSQAPLRTPGVLSSHSHAVQDQINCTMEAFHQATRNGFRLQEVATAPLARRRKQKKNSVDNRSSSSDSNNSTCTSNSSLSVSGGVVGAVHHIANRGDGSRNHEGGSNSRVTGAANKLAAVTISAAVNVTVASPLSGHANSGPASAVAVSVAGHLPPLHASSSSSSSSQSPVRALSRNSSASSISQSSVCSLGFVPQAGMAINNSSRNPSPLASISKKSTPDEPDISSFPHIYSSSGGHFGQSSNNLPSHPSPLTLSGTPASSKSSETSNSVSSASKTLRVPPLRIEPCSSDPSRAVIHIPSVDSRDGDEELNAYGDSSSSIMEGSFTGANMPVRVKYKSGSRRAGGTRGRKSGSTGNTIHTSSGGSSSGSSASSSIVISPVRLTRGRKRKLEQQSLEEDVDKDCVIVERNYPSSPRVSRSAFKMRKSETIIID
ncbi:hypothetical protein EGW08_000987, partial [Elysia chlorotica]